MQPDSCGRRRFERLQSHGSSVVMPGVQFNADVTAFQFVRGR
jgi:hypothetical protein